MFFIFPEIRCSASSNSTTKQQTLKSGELAIYLHKYPSNLLLVRKLLNYIYSNGQTDCKCIQQIEAQKLEMAESHIEGGE